jgi:hypothetical protein
MIRQKSLVLSLCSALWLAAGLQSSSQAFRPLSQSASETNGPPPKLAVHLSQVSDDTFAGEHVQVKVEIWNEGSGDVFVCKDFDKPGWPYCSLTFRVEDASGHTGKQTAGVADFYHRIRQSLLQALMRDWLPLRPNHSYGAIITLSADAYDLLREPGLYRISSKYTSHAPLSSYQGTVQFEPSELVSLHVESWEGQTESNTIEVQVFPRKR